MKTILLFQEGEGQLQGSCQSWSLKKGPWRKRRGPNAESAETLYHACEIASGHRKVGRLGNSAEKFLEEGGIDPLGGDARERNKNDD